jgi:exportin-1
MFAIKHEKPEPMEIGLETLQALNLLVVSEPQVASIFYQNFYLLIIRDILTVMTDYRHVSGFKLQGLILQQMICAVESGSIIQGPINQENGTPHQYPSNKDFVINLLIECIKALFANLNKVQIEAFVWKLFNTCNDWSNFKSTLRDLLISMKSFSSSNDEFYEEERKVSLFFAY